MKEDAGLRSVCSTSVVLLRSDVLSFSQQLLTKHGTVTADFFF